MRKIFACLLTLLLICSLCVSAFADVAYEPSDSFYKSHEKQCSYVNKYVYINGTDGYSVIWKDPTAKVSLATPVNGETVYAAYEYQGWLYIEYNNKNSQTQGWVLKDDTVEVYTGESFLNEYMDKMVTDTDAFSKEFCSIEPTGDQYYLYTYPGSSEIESTIETEYITQDNLFYFDYVYVDDEGTPWGYVNYYMGSRQSWINLSDPENGDLPRTLDKTTELIPAKEIEPGDSPSKPAQAVNDSTNVIVSVIAVCILLIASILVLSKKRTKEAFAAQKAAQKKKKKKK